MHFSKLDIHHFRGIREAHLEDLGRVNVLLGQNNCGKTTVLEALFLTIGIANPSLPIAIDQFRGLRHTEGEDFRFLFYELETDNQPRLSASLSQQGVLMQDRVLQIEPIYRTILEKKSDLRLSNGDIPAPTAGGGTGTDLGRLTGLQFAVKVISRGGDAPPQSLQAIIRHQAQLVQNIPEGYEETLIGYFLPAHTVQDVAGMIEKLLVTKRLTPVLAVLQKVEPRLQNLTLGAQGIIYADLGGPRLIPFNLLGDGVRRILNVLLSIYNNPDGIVLIDEVENGLHHTALQTLWRGLLAVAAEFDVQIFTTTHSREALQQLVQVLASQDMEVHREDTYAITLVRNEEDKVFSYRYGYEALAFALEHENEIR
jgi:hypothetical protein